MRTTGELFICEEDDAVMRLFFWFVIQKKPVYVRDFVLPDSAIIPHMFLILATN